MPSLRAVSNSVDLPLGPESAIGLFLDPGHLRAWWGVERCLVEPYAGGAYTLAWQITRDGLGYVTSCVVRAIGEGFLKIGTVVYLSSQRPVMGPMSLEVVAQPTPSGCRLTVVQDGYREGPDWAWYHEAVETAWPLVLATLADYAEKEASAASE
jgi:hypothetical protein